VSAGDPRRLLCAVPTPNDHLIYLHTAQTQPESGARLAEVVAELRAVAGVVSLPDDWSV
jgi:hypothetical protein